MVKYGGAGCHVEAVFLENPGKIIFGARTYLIAACMPSLRLLNRQIVPKHSFTNSLDSVLSKVGISSGAPSFASFRKNDLMRMPDPEVEPIRTVSSDQKVNTPSALQLNDLGRLANPNYFPK